jgi:hypothetical protein
MALLVAAAFTLALAVTPAPALAKVSTRIVVPSLVTVDNTVQGVEPTAPVITAKAYRKKGAVYVALSAHLHCYFVDSHTGATSLVGQATGSRVSFALSRGRGEYRVTYGGSHTYHSAKATTTRVDMIGVVVSEPVVTVDVLDATYSLATLSWDVTWNTDAYAGPVLFTYIGFFAPGSVANPSSIGTGSVTVSLWRQVAEPETVVVSYRFKTAQAFGDLQTMAMAGPVGDYDAIAGERATVLYTHER